MTFEGDDAWRYDIRTMLTVHGQDAPFEHHDTNRLHRVGPARPNLMVEIARRRAAKQAD